MRVIGIRPDFRRVGIHASHAERADNFPATEQVDVPEEFAARFVPGADRVARMRRLAGGVERVLYRGVHLSLQLQEVTNREILRLQPTRVDAIVFGSVSQVNERQVTRLACSQRDRFRRVGGPQVGQMKRAPSGDEMRPVFAANFEHVRIGAVAPFAIKPIYL